MLCERAMHVAARRWLFGFLLGVTACGGSSSETPPPLPPLPENAPYRSSRRAAAEVPPVARRVRQPEETVPVLPAGQRAKGTWGGSGDTLEPLPELDMK